MEAKLTTNKDSKWYKDIQKLYNVANKFADVDVKDDHDKMFAIYCACREESNKDPDNKFLQDLLIAFVREKMLEVGK